MQEVALPEGRRERKKRETRTALKAATLDLVSERGFNHVTVEDIANAVDVSVRTFFNYFASKEAALVGDDPEMVAAMRAQLLSLPPEVGPLEALRTVLMMRLDTIREDLDASGEDHTVWLRRFTTVRRQPEVMMAYSKYTTIYERALTDAMVERLGGDDQVRGYASLLTTCALNVMKVAGSLWAAQEGRYPLHEVAAAAMDQLAQGFSMSRSSAVPDILSGSVSYLAASCPAAAPYETEAASA